jgi:5'(3')-deoxyribonucleotidase
MSKKTIAVDIDDVVADTTEALRLAVNDVLPDDLKIASEEYRIDGGYWGYYEEVWARNKVDHLISFDTLHDEMAENQDHVKLIEGAKTALQKLCKRYKLVAVTSRNVKWVDATHDWVEKYLSEVFEEIVFVHHDSNDGRTKGDACIEIGADWLIDDNPEHCLSAQKSGTKPILFGEYGWSRATDYRDSFVRCKNWQVVMEFFENES